MNRRMTVKELINALQELNNPDKRLVFVVQGKDISLLGESDITIFSNVFGEVVINSISIEE